MKSLTLLLLLCFALAQVCQCGFEGELLTDEDQNQKKPAEKKKTQAADLLASQEIESDGIRERAIDAHIDSFEEDEELSYAQMLPVALEYFYKINNERYEHVKTLARAHTLEEDTEEEDDHAHINLLEAYLKDNFDGISTISKDDAIIMLSHEKLRAFHEKYLKELMLEKDFLTLHQIEKLQDMNINTSQFEDDKNFKKKLLDDVLAEFHDEIDWSQPGLEGRMQTWTDDEL